MGIELLHLAGNWITFVGIAAFYVAPRGWYPKPDEYAPAGSSSGWFAGYRANGSA
jgi:hypothetical protein